MIRKIVIGILCCVVLFWCGRIYSVNRFPREEHRITMGEEIADDSIKIVPIEAHLFTREEYIDFFDLNSEDVVQNEDTDDKCIFVCLEITNLSDTDLTWDEVMQATTCGFETLTWMSSVAPLFGSTINVFNSERLESGTCQRVWYGTGVSPLCFKEKSWNELKVSDFRYVITLEPTKVSVQLG